MAETCAPAMRPAPTMATRKGAEVAGLLRCEVVIRSTNPRGKPVSTIRSQAARRRVDAAAAAAARPWSASPVIVQRRRGARVLLTDGDDRVTLAVARSLVGAGYDVHSASDRH